MYYRHQQHQSTQHTKEDLLEKLEECAGYIAERWERLELLEEEIRQLESLEMYPAEPTESWQSRNGGEAKYLYMYFSRRRGGYEGPDGKRKVYVGCDPKRIEEARLLADRRRRLNELLRRRSRLVEQWNVKGHSIRGLAFSLEVR